MNHARALAEDRDGFRFRGGSSAIDLAATLQGRLQASPRELLAGPADLDRWLVSSGLTPASPRASASDVTLARDLREAIFTLAGGIGTGSLDAKALATLNRIAAEPAAAPSLRSEGEMDIEPSASGLLSLLARDAIYLFGGAAAGRLRQCEAPACTIFFVDTSRSGDRRWCSMSACGNKAKVAEHRKRHRAASRRSQGQPDIGKNGAAGED